jgi:SAM-dependent methyltransferase
VVVLRKVVDCREWLVERLGENLSIDNRRLQIKKILILGGGVTEPELRIFDRETTEIHYAGIAPDSDTDRFYFLDLDEYTDVDMTYDLIICNQVLEHLFNLESAFKYFQALVKKDGYVWVTCPANNFPHGSPNYYSAGYSREFLEVNLSKKGFLSVDVGELTSRRIYLFRHLLHVWPTYNQIKFPLIAPFGFDGNMPQKIIYNLKTLFWRVGLGFSSKRLIVNGNFPLETFGFFQKTN